MDVNPLQMIENMRSGEENHQELNEYWVRRELILSKEGIRAQGNTFLFFQPHRFPFKMGMSTF